MQWKALFVGDIVIDQAPVADILTPEFSAIMQEHDLCACNFEAAIRGKGSPIKKAGPHVHQHAEAPAWVEKAGFNVISLANNHIYDYGQEALSATIHAFQKAICVGAGNNFEEAYALKQVTIQGIKVGLLSFCEAEFGALTLYNRNAGYAWINHPAVSTIIAEAKKNTDVLLIQCHTGVEQIDVPLPEWRERYKELIRFGADAVIGSHPHVPQGWEMYLGKPIFYSLGNFYFDGASDHPLWTKGIAVSLTFEHKKLINFEVIAIEKTKNGIVVNKEEQYRLHLEGLNKELAEPVYSARVKELALSLWNQYYRSYYNMALQGINGEVGLKTVFITFIKRILFRRKTGISTSLLLHNIRIESHRWIVERALHEMNNA